jgi:hypothetical protein
MKRGNSGKSTYDLANDVIRRAGYDDPEALSESERFDIVMRHILTVGKPKINELSDQPRNSKESDH